jgi:hypothetical protein
VSELHAALARTLVLYLAAVGAWGLLLGARGLGPTSSYRGALAIAELAAIVQGIAGVALVLAGRTLEPIHALYGLALVLVIPLAATLIRDRQPRGRSIALGLALLFAAGLAIRGITTA